MKKYLCEFLRRGFFSFGFGPIILATLCLILSHHGAVDTLTAEQVCIGIFSLSALAFIAGGMNTIYQIEQLPLMAAILIHGSVLYVSYLVTYLVNGWLDWGIVPILVFSAIFVLGFLLIWAIIFATMKRRTDRINAMLRKKRENTEEV